MNTATQIKSNKQKAIGQYAKLVGVNIQQAIANLRRAMPFMSEPALEKALQDEKVLVAIQSDIASSHSGDIAHYEKYGVYRDIDD